MFDFLFPNHPFGGHTLRLVAQAQQGGGDIFDIARAMKNVETGDKDGWERAWLELAQKTESRAQEALDAGHERTPSNIFFMPATTTECPMCCSPLRKKRSVPNDSANRGTISGQRLGCTTRRSR